MTERLITVYISRKLHRRIKDEAKRRGVKVQFLAETSLELGLNHLCEKKEK